MNKEALTKSLGGFGLTAIGIVLIFCPVFIGEEVIVPCIGVGTFLAAIGSYALSTIGGGAPISRQKRAARSSFRLAIALALFIVSALYFYKSFVWSETEINQSYAVIATIALISGSCFLLFSTENMYNRFSTDVKRIDAVDFTFEQMLQDFAEVDTPLGRIWRSDLTALSIKSDVLVFGPEQDGSFICGQYLNGNFYLSASDNTNFLGDEESIKKHTVKLSSKFLRVQPKTEEEEDDSSSSSMNASAVLANYVTMFREYANGSGAFWPGAL